MKRVLVAALLFSALLHSQKPTHAKQATSAKRLTESQQNNALRVVRAYREFRFVLDGSVNYREYSAAYLDLRKKVAPFISNVPAGATKTGLQRALSNYEDARAMWASYLQPNGQSYSAFYMLNSHILRRYFNNLKQPKADFDTPVNFDYVLYAVWSTAKTNAEYAAASIKQAQ